MSIFDKIEKEFDEDGVLRVVDKPQHEQQQKRKEDFVPCTCVWDVTTDTFLEMCDNHNEFISSQHDTIVLVGLYKATSDENEDVYVVAGEFNEAVEMAEIYFEEEEGDELRGIKLSYNAIVKQ